jgi:HAD superfamily hydrolase (TIGR01509 family)
MPLSRPPAAVLFDMDGLLLDSERVALGIMAACARELGLVWNAEVGLRIIGRNVDDSNRILREHYGNDARLDALPAAFRARYDRHIDDHAIPHKPGVTALLDLLDAHGIARAVATSTQRERAARKLERNGLLRRFDALVGGDEVARGKPAPDIFLAAARALDVPPSVCLVLEDSNSGARAALAAHMAVVVVPDLLEPDADVIAMGALRQPSLVDVAARLGALFNREGLET